MNFFRKQAIFACSLLLAGAFSAPVLAQGRGVIATWDCPKRSGGHARAATPAPAQYQAVRELEQYVAQLQAELAKSERSQSKRMRSSR